MAKSYLEEALQGIANRDVQTLVKKDAEYGSSWKRRGGIGAFFTFIRKADRLETQVTDARQLGVDKYDVFGVIEKQLEEDASSESLLETIRDLRRYLALVESEIVLRKWSLHGGHPIPATEANPEWKGERCGYTPPVDGKGVVYAGCTRNKGHEGPCAHPLAGVVDIEDQPIVDAKTLPLLRFETKTPGHVIIFDRMPQGAVGIEMQKAGSQVGGSRLLNAEQVQKLKEWL